MTFKRPEIALRLFLLVVQNSVEKGIVPVLVLVLAAQFGTSSGAAILVAATALAIAATLASGELPRFMPVKRILFFSEVVRAVGIAIVMGGIALSGEVAGTLLLGYSLITIGNGISAPAGQGLLMEVASSDEDEWVFRAVLWVNNLTFSTAPIIAAIAYVSGYIILFLSTIMGLSLLGMATIILMLKDGGPIPDKRPWSEFRAFGVIENSFRVLKNPTFRIYFMVTCTLASLNLQPGYYIGTLLAEEIDHARVDLVLWTANLTGAEISAYQRSSMTIVVVLFAGVVGILARRLSPANRFIFGVPAFALAFGVIPVLRDPISIFCTSAIAGLAQLIFVPTHSLLAAQLAPPGEKARYAAVNELRYRVAALVGAASVGAVGVVPPMVMGVAYVVIGSCLLPAYLQILARSKLERSEGQQSAQGRFAAR